MFHFCSSFFFFFFSSRRRHTRYIGDWSSDVCSSDLRPPDHHALAIDDERHGNPADAVFPGDGHPGVDERRQAVAVLLHEWLDVLLAAAVKGDEIDKEVLPEARLEVLEALQLARAGGAPGGAEAQDHDFPAERS